MRHHLANLSRNLAPGLHIMPMGKYKTTGEILEAIPRRLREGERAQV